MATQLKKAEGTPSERFTAMVSKEFAGMAGTTAQITQFQKRLIQNYFIAIDIALKTAEVNRLKKAEKYRDKTPVTWENVNMPQLAVNVVSSARMALDPVLPNHINMVPYKNNSTGKYDIGFIIGYRGKEVFAKKFGYEPPDDIIVELVFENDIFELIKKDKDNPTETYIFQVKKPFQRGVMLGGFYYHVFDKTPSRNKIVPFSKEEIDKRKPKYASTEFWGGEKAVYGKDGNKTGETEMVEGWYFEMARKTLLRAGWGDVTIDSQKIDDDFIRLSQQEAEHQLALQASNDPDIKANQNANKEPIDVDFEDLAGDDNVIENQHQLASEDPKKDKSKNTPKPKEDENPEIIQAEAKNNNPETEEQPQPPVGRMF
jgi:recombination protein RecT